jgi:hypothetical protein
MTKEGIAVCVFVNMPANMPGEKADIMKDIQIVNDDVIKWAEQYDGPPFMALLADPPYNFQFMSAAWDNAVAMHPETWIALSKHLYPGAFIFAFGGARTYHRLAVALENAGLRIHPAIGWVNGQGFCKATRVDTQVDKAAGKLDDRKVVGRYQLPNGEEWNLTQADDRDAEAAPGAFTASGRRTLNIETPATPLAQAWEGHRYGGQVLRPCLELIAVAQKPYGGRPVDDITGSGAGTLWIGGCRIDRGTDQGGWPANILFSHVSPSICPNCDGAGGIDFPTWYARERKNGGTLARWRRLTGGMSCWICLKCDGAGVVGGCRQVGVKKVKPAGGDIAVGSKGAGPRDNQVYSKDDRPRGSWKAYKGEDGMETVTAWECVEECPVRMLAEQSGQLTSGARSGRRNQPKTKGIYGEFELRDESPPPGSKGTAARFFFQADWNHEVAERLDSTNSAFYCPKASRRERDIGLYKLPFQTFNRVNSGGLEHEPRWAPTEVRNPHPTIKPITLARYLATLLLPPDIYSPRRLLVPFAGVASEMIGAYLAGWEEIVGVEFVQDHCDIGEMRLDWWKRASKGAGTANVKEILKWARKQS